MSRRFLIGLIALWMTSVSNAMISVEHGNKPISDRNWPAGSVEVANLSSRIAYFEGPPFGGGEYQFYCHGDTQAMQAALDALAKIRAPQRALIIHDGPIDSPSFLADDKDPKAVVPVDWVFTVWTPQNWYQLHTNPKSVTVRDDSNSLRTLPPPTIDVYVGAGGIDWTKIKVPPEVTVTEDERADANGAVGPLIRGDVFDMITSKAVPGAKIVLTKFKAPNAWEKAAEGKSDEIGRFEMKDFPAGSYRVDVVADGYASRSMSSVRLTRNTLKGFTVLMSPAATIAGTVTDTDGKALAGVKVGAGCILALDGRSYLPPDDLSAMTDEQGRFTLAGLPRGFVCLRPRDDSHAALESMTVRPVPAKDVALRMTDTGTVRGRLLDQQGQPVHSGTVGMEVPGDRLGKWGGEMNIKPDGTYEFTHVPPGVYFISANPGALMLDSDPTAKKIEVKMHQTIEMDLTTNERPQ